MKRGSGVAAVVLVSAIGLAGCASEQAKKQEAQENMSPGGLPQWVSAPDSLVEGYAATGCVPWGGDFSIAEAMALTDARDKLAQGMRIKVAGLNKKYQSSTTSGTATTTGKTFTAATQQLVDETLSGARQNRTDFVNLADQKNLCSMVVIDPARLKAFLAQYATLAPAALRPTSEETLYQEFKAQKAQEELDQKLNESRQQ